MPPHQIAILRQAQDRLLGDSLAMTRGRRGGDMVGCYNVGAMLAYDEIVTIEDSDGKVLGKARMIGWVILREDGQRSWWGEFSPIPGRPFDFDFPSLERSGLRVVCEDGATARILKPIIEDARSFGFRCWFEGIWPPPRAKELEAAGWPAVAG